MQRMRAALLMSGPNHLGLPTWTGPCHRGARLRRRLPRVDARRPQQLQGLAVRSRTADTVRPLPLPCGSTRHQYFGSNSAERHGKAQPLTFCPFMSLHNKSFHLHQRPAGAQAAFSTGLVHTSVPHGRWAAHG